MFLDKSQVKLDTYLFLKPQTFYILLIVVIENQTNKPFHQSSESSIADWFLSYRQHFNLFQFSQDLTGNNDFLYLLCPFINF